jgi:hypothetical protein
MQALRLLEAHMATCSTSNCEKEAREGDKCWGCARARRRNGTVERTHPEKRQYRHPTPREMVLEACSHIQDVDALDDAAWERAWHRLRMAMRRYVLKGRRVK